MTKITKSTYKNSPVIYKIRKPRYYYQDVYLDGKTYETKNVSVIPFEGLDYEYNNEFLKINRKELWNRNTISETDLALVPISYNTRYVFGGYTMVGSLFTYNNVSKGFSASNYIKLNPLTIPNSSFETVVCFTTPSSFRTSIAAEHIGFNSEKYTNFELYVIGPSTSSTEKTKLQLDVCGNGSSWGGSIKSLEKLQTNTTYWAKIQWDGSTWSLSLSTDGIQYELQGSCVASFGNLSKNVILGNANMNSYKTYFTGSIDMNKSYIKIDDEIVWQPTTDIITTQTKYLTSITVRDDYSIVGTLNNYDNIISGFSSSNYIKPNLTFDHNSKPWEVCMKFKTSTLSSTEQYLFQACSGTGNGGRYGLILYFTTKFGFNISSNNSSWIVSATGTTDLQRNTIYWVKLSYDGSKYELSYSLNGEDYISEIVVEEPTPLYNSLPNSYIGIYSTTSFQYPNLGWIYLDDCKFIIDGQDIWDRTKTKSELRELYGCLDNMPDVPEEKTYVAYTDGMNVVLKNSDTPYKDYIWVNNITIPSHELKSYYKLDYDCAGTMTYDEEYNVNNFSSSNYILTPYLFGDEPFDFIMKGRITSQANGNMLLVCNESSNNYPELYLQKAAKTLSVYNGSAITGKTVIPVDTWYWFRLCWDGTTLSWFTKLFEDGDTVVNVKDKEWTLENSTTTNHFNQKAIFRLGGPTASTSTYFWHGSIDLSNVIYYENNEVIWRPMIKYY